jgi:hypothetical protein
VAGCPNFYSQVFLTIPANTPYYTYAARTIFVNSSQSRNIFDLSVVQLSGLNGERLTEDGKSGSYPATSSSTGLFYDGSPTSWIHHWSQRAEVPSSVTLINAQSFEGTWPPAGWTKTGNWNKENNRAYQGTYSADFDGEGTGVSGNLVTSSLDCSDAVSISVSFRFYDENVDGNQFRLEYFDGISWVGIADLGSSSESTWNLYQQEITDPRYFISGFKIRWVADNIRAGGGSNNEHAYVDLVNISKKVANPGAGIMFTDNNNQNLYIFDSMAEDNTGAINVLSSRIEVNPVERYEVDYPFPLDLTWRGAVVTFDGEPIYPRSGDVGLWVMVEYPPSVTVN